MDDHMTPFCQNYHRALEILGKRWTGEIVRALLAGNCRFTEFTASIPKLSDRLLSERLKDLETEGIVVRDVIPQTPVRIEYRLTEKGRALASVVGAVSEWADAWVAPAKSKAPKRMTTAAAKAGKRRAR